MYRAANAGSSPLDRSRAQVRQETLKLETADDVDDVPGSFDPHCREKIQNAKRDLPGQPAAITRSS
jgi:hypothetical protein